jgi:hypothetical protein
MSIMGIYATVLLKRKIDEVIARPKFQPGMPRWDGTPATWCNEAVHAIMTELGYDMTPILELKGRRIGWTGATMMFDLAAVEVESTNSAIIEMEPFQAQAAANIGVPILAAARRKGDKGSSHVGIVYPTDDLWNAKKGPLIGQAGSTQTHGIHSAYDSFVKWGLIGPRYFQLPQKEDSKDA